MLIHADPRGHAGPQPAIPAAAPAEPQAASTGPAPKGPWS
ncbi:MAG: hypothetical protein ACJAVC_001029 [Brevundimonas sp.]